MTTATATITVEIPEEQAEALAQFCKRAGYSTFRDYAKTDEEAYAAQYALNEIRAALAKAGHDPR